MSTRRTQQVRMWDVFEGHKNNAETWRAQSECLALAFRPDGRELCVAALDGQLYFYDVENGTLKFTIEGRKDVQVRAVADTHTDS